MGRWLCYLAYAVCAQRNTMQTFICVYRRYIPKNAEWKRTVEVAESDPRLADFIRLYLDSYFDWGDDPSFYSAQTWLGDVNSASWGVCRRDVRGRLREGDLVIFFCCRPRPPRPSRICDYYYIGFGTIQRCINRQDLWTNKEYSPYRQFYNVLAEYKGGELHQKETFYPHHSNWRDRCKSDYVLFSREKELTTFNLNNPLHVATYDGTHIPEQWRREAVEVEKLLFVDNGLSRRLRTSTTGYGHAPINLTKKLGGNVVEFRNNLLHLSNKFADS